MRESIRNVIKHNAEMQIERMVSKIISKTTYDITVQIFGNSFFVPNYESILLHNFRLQPLVKYRKMKKRKQ